MNNALVLYNLQRRNSTFKHLQIWNLNDIQTKDPEPKIRAFTENRRIENARTPIRRRMKTDRTFPNASRRLAALASSEAAIDGSIRGLKQEEERDGERYREGFCRS